MLFAKLISAAELRHWVRLSSGATATGEIIRQSYEGAGETDGGLSDRPRRVTAAGGGGTASLCHQLGDMLEWFNGGKLGNSAEDVWFN